MVSVQNEANKNSRFPQKNTLVYKKEKRPFQQEWSEDIPATFMF